MEFPGRRRPGSLGTPTLRRRMDRMLPFSERRTSKVWDHYTQLSMHRVECNHCKRQLSFHNSTTSMREHLGRKHSIRDGAVPPPNTAEVPNPSTLRQHVAASTLLNSRFATSNPPADVPTGSFQPVVPVIVKEEQNEEQAAEAGEAKHTCTTFTHGSVGGVGSSNANSVPSQDVEPTYGFSPEELNTTLNNSGGANTSGARGCSDKRAGLFTDLILEMVYRDLQPFSVVEERGFRLLLSCLEPNYPVPSPSLLGNLLCHRYHILKQCLQQHLQTGLAPRCMAICTEHWRSVDGCGVEGIGQFYLTVSAHFVDSNWQLARCVLNTRPIEEYKGNTTNSGPIKFANTLKAVLSEFHLPESYVFCVVHDTPWGMEGRRQGSITLDQDYQQEFPGPSHASMQSLPEGWEPLLCAGEALKICVQEGLYVETVRQALADARGIVLHFQHDVNAAAALNQKAEAANKGAPRLVLDDPGRWATAIDMCERLLELKWVVSSVLEEQKAAPNLADHQWRLLHELVPVLKTVRIAASFLSEDINASISSLMPCLQGVSRILGQNIAECSCPVVRGIMERIRTGMEKRWRLTDEESLLDSPAVLSSFLDPRFKEMRFLSPHARSKLHDKVKELLSVQTYTDDREVDQDIDSGLEVRENDTVGEPAVLGLDDQLPIPTVASLDSPESCPSCGEEGDSIELQQNENFVAVLSPEHISENITDSPSKATGGCKRAANTAELSSPLTCDRQLSGRMRISPVPQSMYDILLGEDPTERMPEIQQQLENYIAEPLCKRSLSPLHWWRNKEHRFPAVARLARRYLSIPATAIPADRAFAPRESPVAHRRAMLGPKNLDQVLFLHQNCDYVEQLKGNLPGHREIEHNSSLGGNQSRDSLYQTLVSYDNKV
ncbi:zinc finger BED domain-containing protein 4 [Clarias gariepinus]|uniref:zinc finger BED domain-containing protein 4 n=1 Tax=Clarias gariepinus TaxID=13013 RepID=UPI00234D0F9B|nr:zinc finger BED domain-containing protein 4 [Clarias gariepinus]XP_053341321.1 zinc finger BED domain-containing protein 4 [Clarias gariepinus]XP_053341322.1 zinc finger BED domain-containing protein 4 [Clarias gariepinus]